MKPYPLSALAVFAGLASSQFAPFPNSTQIAPFPNTTETSPFSNSTQPDFSSELRPCPASCHGSPDKWTIYSSVERLLVCEEPILLDFVINNPLSDPNTSVKLQSCTAGNAGNMENALIQNITHAKSRRDATCGLAAREGHVTLDVAMSEDCGNASIKDVDTLLQKAESYLANEADCKTSFVAGYFKGAAVAFYIGSAMDKRATLASVVERITAQAPTGETPKDIMVQLCGSGRDAEHTLGIAVNSAGDLAAVQEAVKAWSEATCVKKIQKTSQLYNIKVVESPFFNRNGTNSTAGFNETISNINDTLTTRALWRRAECRTRTVVGGDLCGTLATKCGISTSAFNRFNSRINCNNLARGQRVCCSAGTLPDIKPKPNADGSCKSHTIKSGDTCFSLAASNGLKVADLVAFNDKTTWGWTGCGDLKANVAICLSKGRPPLPAPVANAVCGPTKPGTKAPKDGKLADVNPCPLNSCCNIWGQCGITPEFCTVSKGPTGNPGTSASGKNGCISNCGTKVTNNKVAPSSFQRIGYYESWNFDRDCLNMRADSIDTSFYTHVHWAFGSITNSFDVSINNTFKQWERFQSLDAKKILSFGGWGYSTEPATYNILRQAMSPTNAGKFADNVVAFLQKNKLDGVDFDWEYPGAKDIKGTPPGFDSDGPNYLSFLKLLKGKLPKGKTLSIAAPASFWYLKNFPIAKMAETLDYIVYMTYDLHGQWDYSNQWSQEGCLAGNCLRSHVNLTETGYALAMVTKAGVPADKVFVGISNYGRSFKMTKAGCTGPTCTFVGPESAAKKGRCTDTAGYLANAEIDNIIAREDEGTKTWHDKESNSDIMVYANTEWTAYMSPKTRKSRSEYYKSLNFAGIIDWAVDLEYWSDDSLNGDDLSDLGMPPKLNRCEGKYDSMEALDKAGTNIPFECRGYYIVQALSGTLKSATKTYNDILNKDYDKSFKMYADFASKMIGKTVRDFVRDNGNKYFSCEVSEESICCDRCPKGERRCDYCFKDGPCTVPCHDKFGDCPGGGLPALATSRRKVPEPCPPDYSKRGNKFDGAHIWWSLNNDKKDRFFRDLEAATGVKREKVTFGDYPRGENCIVGVAADDDDCFRGGTDFGMAVVHGFVSADVDDPRAVVKKALDRSSHLATDLEGARLALRSRAYYGNEMDLVDAVSLPVLQVAEAVAGMQRVVEVANQLEEQEAARRKSLILGFVTAVLFLVPVAGEALGAVASLATVGTVVTALGIAGNIAYEIYDVVKNDANVGLAIASIILEPLALLDALKVAKAAKLRRGLDDVALAKMGSKLGDRMGTIRKLTGVCSKN